MTEPQKAGPRGSDSKAWMGILAFFVVLALLGPTFVYRGVFDPDRGKPSPVDVTHEAKGVVESVDPKERRVMIAHEAIPGVMPAMTMPFIIRDESTIRSLAPGDVVEFSFRMQDRGVWIESIRKTGEAAPAVSASPGD